MIRTLHVPSLLGRLFVGLALTVTALGGASADSVRGGMKDADTLSPGDKMSYTLTFRGGETARAAATTDSDNDDIDIYVYDEEGNLIVKDDDEDNTPVCEWRPSWTGKFKIVVKNACAHTVDYGIATN